VESEKQLRKKLEKNWSRIRGHADLKNKKDGRGPKKEKNQAAKEGKERKQKHIAKGTGENNVSEKKPTG